MEPMNFDEMNLSEEILRAIEEMGFEEATPIQARSITAILEGKDVIGQSQTGSGKTAAFGIPCIEKTDADARSVQTLILCPTRELAIQISEEFRRLLKYKDGIRVLPIYGGQPIDRQILALKKGAHIIVGTPGRVMDHMRRRTIRLQNVKMFVLDEADEMLDMGFREDIETILEDAPDERQTILFSATMPKEILDLTNKYQNEPEFIKVVHKELTVPTIEQLYYEVSAKSKPDALCRIIDMENPSLTLVFCNTKKGVDDLVEQLQGRGYFAEGLHGDLKQAQRDKVMSKFRNGTLEILVATDVAARGIDVDDIEIVVNYDVPQDEEYYVHRIGRTGRAGKDGKACTFVVGRDIFKLRDIMTYAKTKITRASLPRIEDVESARLSSFLREIRNIVEDGRLTKYVDMIEGFLEGEEFGALETAAALLKLRFNDNGAEGDFVLELERELKRQSDERRKKYDKNVFFEKEGTKNKPGKAGKSGKTGKEKEKMATLLINAGKNQNIRVNDLVGAIAGETGLPGKILGAIDLRDEYALIDVPKKHAKEIVQKMKSKKIKGIKIKVEQTGQ